MLGEAVKTALGATIVEVGVLGEGTTVSAPREMTSPFGGGIADAMSVAAHVARRNSARATFMAINNIATEDVALF